jgi:hypothetical protein
MYPLVAVSCGTQLLVSRLVPLNSSSNVQFQEPAIPSGVELLQSETVDDEGGEVVVVVVGTRPGILVTRAAPALSGIMVKEMNKAAPAIPMDRTALTGG